MSPAKIIDEAALVRWLHLCIASPQLVAEYDRLRGTNLLKKGDSLAVTIDEGTGKYEADARDFFEFCTDLFLRLPS